MAIGSADFKMKMYGMLSTHRWNKSFQKQNLRRNICRYDPRSCHPACLRASRPSGTKHAQVTTGASDQKCWFRFHRLYIFFSEISAPRLLCGKLCYLGDTTLCIYICLRASFCECGKIYNKIFVRLNKISCQGDEDTGCCFTINLTIVPTG